MIEETTRSGSDLSEIDGAEDALRGKYLTFHIDREDYGIEILHVTEIIGIQNITEVPEMPVFVKGVINLRGQVIPVMDVRARFKLPPRDYDDRTCIIVVRLGETSVGMVVDKVNEVASIEDSRIESAPNTRGSEDDRYIRGLGNTPSGVIILLDVHQLVHYQQLAAVEDAVA